jgi:ABC-type transport system substrate-binding protein
MRQSVYDTDGDGLCDADECTGPIMLGAPESPGAEIAQSIAEDLEQIGVRVDVQLLDNRYEVLDEPSNRIPMNTWAAWSTAPYDPTEIAGPVFHSDFIGPKACCNEVLLGATPEQLDGWGYPVDAVPSVDADIERCDAMPLGDERTQCWVKLDQKITEMAVWVPLYQEKITRTLSERVLSAPWSPIYQFIAFDQVSLAPDG